MDANATAEGEPEIVIRVYIPDLNANKCIVVYALQKIVVAQSVILSKIAKPLEDMQNYAFYLPATKAGLKGEFLDEERTLEDFSLRGHVPNLEFRHIVRDYGGMTHLTEKQVIKANTSSMKKKFIEMVKSNQVKKVEKMLDQGLDPNYNNENGNSPLGIASGRGGTKELILQLVKGGAHLSFRGKDGLTPVHRAAIGCNQEAISTLLSLGASPNYRDAKGLTPLYHSVVMGDDLRPSLLLLMNYGDVNIRDVHDHTELHQAAKYGHAAHVEILLRYRCDIHAVNNNGNTALHIAANNGHAEVAKILLRRGGRKDITNTAGNTVSEVAMICGHRSLAATIVEYPENEVELIKETPEYNITSKFAPKHTNRMTIGDLTPHSPVQSQMKIPGSPNARNIASAMRQQYIKDHPSQSDLFERTRVSSFPESSVSPSHSRLQERRGTDGPAMQSKHLQTPLRCLVKQDYTPHRAGELLAQKGMMVEVYSMRPDGMCMVQSGERKGWIHSRYLKKVPSINRPPPSSRQPQPVGSSSSALGKVSSDHSSLAGHLSDPGRTASLNEADLVPRTVRVPMQNRGYGFALRGVKATAYAMKTFRPTLQVPALQYIAKIDSGSSAEKSGLKEGDFLLALNGKDVVFATHNDVVAIIKATKGSVLELKVVNPVHTEAIETRLKERLTVDRESESISMPISVTTPTSPTVKPSSAVTAPSFSGAKKSPPIATASTSDLHDPSRPAIVNHLRSTKSVVISPTFSTSSSSNSLNQPFTAGNGFNQKESSQDLTKDSSQELSSSPFAAEIKKKKEEILKRQAARKISMDAATHAMSVSPPPSNDLSSDPTPRQTRSQSLPGGELYQNYSEEEIVATSAFAAEILKLKAERDTRLKQNSPKLTKVQSKLSLPAVKETDLPQSTGGDIWTKLMEVVANVPINNSEESWEQNWTDSDVQPEIGYNGTKEKLPSSQSSHNRSIPSYTSEPVLSSQLLTSSSSSSQSINDEEILPIAHTSPPPTVQSSENLTSPSHTETPTSTSSSRTATPTKGQPIKAPKPKRISAPLAPASFTTSKEDKSPVIKMSEDDSNDEGRVPKYKSIRSQSKDNASLSSNSLLQQRGISSSNMGIDLAAITSNESFNEAPKNSKATEEVQNEHEDKMKNTKVGVLPVNSKGHFDVKSILKGSGVEPSIRIAGHEREEPSSKGRQASDINQPTLKKSEVFHLDQQVPADLNSESHSLNSNASKRMMTIQPNKTINVAANFDDDNDESDAKETNPTNSTAVQLVDSEEIVSMTSNGWGNLDIGGFGDMTLEEPMHNVGETGFTRKGNLIFSTNAVCFHDDPEMEAWDDENMKRFSSILMSPNTTLADFGSPQSEGESIAPFQKKESIECDVYTDLDMMDKNNRPDSIDLSEDNDQEKSQTSSEPPTDSPQEGEAIFSALNLPPPLCGDLDRPGSSLYGNGSPNLPHPDISYDNFLAKDVPFDPTELPPPQIHEDETLHERETNGGVTFSTKPSLSITGVTVTDSTTDVDIILPPPLFDGEETHHLLVSIPPPDFLSFQPGSVPHSEEIIKAPEIPPPEIPSPEIPPPEIPPPEIPPPEIPPPEIPPPEIPPPEFPPPEFQPPEIPPPEIPPPKVILDSKKDTEAVVNEALPPPIPDIGSTSSQLSVIIDAPEYFLVPDSSSTLSEPTGYCQVEEPQTYILPVDGDNINSFSTTITTGDSDDDGPPPPPPMSPPPDETSTTDALQFIPQPIESPDGCSPVVSEVKIMIVPSKFETDSSAEDDVFGSSGSSLSLPKAINSDLPSTPPQLRKPFSRYSLAMEEGKLGENLSSPGYKSKPVSHWSVEEVCEWLCEIGLEEHKKTFQDNDIVGEHLIELTKDDLRELGINRLGHRLTITKKLQHLMRIQKS